MIREAGLCVEEEWLVERAVQDIGEQGPQVGRQELVATAGEFGMGPPAVRRAVAARASPGSATPPGSSRQWWSGMTMTDPTAAEQGSWRGPPDQLPCRTRRTESTQDRGCPLST